MTPVSVRLFFQQLTCSVTFVPFEKLLLSVRLCLLSGIFDNVIYDVAELD